MATVTRQGNYLQSNKRSEGVQKSLNQGSDIRTTYIRPLDEAQLFRCKPSTAIRARTLRAWQPDRRRAGGPLFAVTVPGRAQSSGEYQYIGCKQTLFALGQHAESLFLRGTRCGVHNSVSELQDVPCAHLATGQAQAVLIFRPGTQGGL